MTGGADASGSGGPVGPGRPAAVRHAALGDLVSAASFLTVAGRGRRPGPGAVAWFPMVGMALGAALGGLWWAVARVWPPLLAAGLVVVADAAATGMLHLDAVADAGDGLLPHMEPARRLQVMREPTIGAFGVVVVAVVLLLRWSALSALRPAGAGGAVLLLGGLWAASRTVMALSMALVPPARPDSLAAGFVGSGRWPCWVAGAVGLAGSAAALLGWHLRAGGVALAAALTAGAGVVALGRRRVGGYTGDVLGAAGVAAETVGLVVAAVRW